MLNKEYRDIFEFTPGRLLRGGGVVIVVVFFGVKMVDDVSIAIGILALGNWGPLIEQ